MTLKRTIGRLASFALLIFFGSIASASGGYKCTYELREYHGSGFIVLGYISNLNSVCGLEKANQQARERCERDKTAFRSCEFVECFEDPFLDCPNSIQ